MEEINKNKYSFFICLIFLILVFGTAIANLFSSDRFFSENENRYLASMPEFSFSSLAEGKFTAGYETYITDQFIERDRWIGLKTWSERALLKQDINGVFFAKDGYLIEKHDAIDVDQEQMKKNAERLAEFVYVHSKTKGVDHVKVMLVPTASVILTDKLPPFAPGFHQEILVNQFLTDLGNLNHKDTGNSDELSNLIPVTDMLKRYKDEYIYYRTDHHWTSLGAYYAYQAWAKDSGIISLQQEDFEIKPATNEFYGTIYSKVNIKVEPDIINLYNQKNNSQYTVEFNLGEKQMDSLYDMEQLNGKDKYSVFLGGNNALVRIKSSHKNGKKLLVIKDSFAHSFVPFAAAHFEETVMVDLRYFNKSLKEFMGENKFTDILVLYNIINFAKDRNTIKLLK